MSIRQPLVPDNPRHSTSVVEL